MAVAHGACSPYQHVCVTGDQQACTCLADHTFGYRTCLGHAADGIEQWTGCDCIVGLAPDAGPAIVPYRSGGGTGGGSLADAGHP